MPTYELSTNDHGVIAEAIAGRYTGFPPHLEATIKTHLEEHYDRKITTTEAVTLYSKSRDISSEVTFAMLDGVDVPDDGTWGYSSGWIPDDIIAAQCPLATDGDAEGTTEPQNRGRDAGNVGIVYYAIEVKSVASGDRVRLTENQQEMMATVDDTLDHVHPVVVIVDLGGLPESVEITVDIYQDSVWADGQTSKTV